MASHDADITAQFEAAVEHVKTAPADKSASDAHKLKIYALYKQATEGDVTGSAPWAVNVVAKAKYNARVEVKGMSKEDAMKAYIALVA
jgi:diazepam-binding inhibitor (GABA receptor modulating acyl-CoA-binding protein)